MPLTSACAIGSAIVASLFVTLLLSSPRADEIAAVFPPWWTAARTIEAAATAGDIAGLGVWRSVVVVRGDAADLAGRLRRSGALVTLDARSFTACGPSEAGRVP